jgi:hypothetical protein
MTIGEDLASSEYVARRENIIVAGHSGAMYWGGSNREACS